MKYYIRTGNEDELVVPSGAQLVVLFRQRFLAPEDEVRREGSARWRKLRDIPEYASMIRAERTERLQFKWILYGVLLVTLASLLYGMLVS
jgi:hypothetical protein